MGNIVLLDELTINKIAAGEVVERPASVVKELVENSIDAGATNISVEIRNGGISYIRITDNGKGIATDDMEIAFERHATSKIRQAEDLDVVKSMGFRGEALASIAAIANVELISKQQSSDIGNRIVVEAGNVLEREEMGCPVGTTITVKNLFFNTPVRYKFLKKDYTEAGYIEDTITRLALINPHIAFKLVNSGKVIVKTYGDGNLNNVIYSIFGKDIASAIVNVDYEYDGVHVSGVVGKPEIARSNRTNQIFFVNKRYVKDKTLAGATEQAFKGLLPIGKYGFLVLNVEMNPAKVDVNVHPAKLEVRFEEENTVFKAIYHAIQESLLKTELVENTEKEPDTEETKNMGLAVIPEEKRIFGKLFKNKKKKEEWEIPEEDEKNHIANIYKNKYGDEDKNTEYNGEGDISLKSKTVQEDSVEYNRINGFSNFKPNINANVLDKIAMLQKQVAEDLDNNPNLVYDRNRLAEGRKKLEELREGESNIAEINDILGLKEQLKENNFEELKIKNDDNDDEKTEIKLSGNEPTENEINQPEDVKDIEQSVSTGELTEQANVEKKLEENIEDNDEKRIIENNIEIEKEQEGTIHNNQILQSSEEKSDNIDKILEANNNNENFDQMYAKIFGRNVITPAQTKEENSANDIATFEDENKEAQFTPYETIKNNNVSVFESNKGDVAPNYKFIGIAFSTYIIIEIKKELYIIDQHAAHERIMYEKVKKNFYSDEEKDSQLLLLPDIINLTHKELDIVKDNWEVFEKAGFELDYFGENTIKLTGVPDICYDLDTKELFLETLDEINTVARTAKQEIEEKFIATIACKAAVKANMALDDEEVHALMEELLKLPNPFTCPHGRPTAIKMNKFDLEKKFSRRK